MRQLPFVKSIRYNQTPLKFKRLFEAGFFGNSFGAGVNQLVADACCLIALQGELYEKLGRMVLQNWAPRGVVYFMLFMVLIFYYARLTLKSLRKIEEEPQDTLKTEEDNAKIRRARKINVIASCGCVIGFFFYLSILTFAIGIYSYIPNIKSGGDYTESIPVKIFCKQEFSNAIPPEIQQELGSPTNSLILLDENGTSIFIASKNDGHGPAAWQTNILYRPKVFEIRRDAITSISYLNPSK